jgi:hypothetical protein
MYPQNGHSTRCFTSVHTEVTWTPGVTNTHAGGLCSACPLLWHPAHGLHSTQRLKQGHCVRRAARAQATGEHVGNVP